jgi:multidrug efflux pump subunit AcrB
VAKVDDVGLTFITGGQREAIRMIPDPARLAAARVPLSSVMEAIVRAGAPSRRARCAKMGRRWRDRRGAFAAPMRCAV